MKEKTFKVLSMYLTGDETALDDLNKLNHFLKTQIHNSEYQDLCKIQQALGITEKHPGYADASIYHSVNLVYRNLLGKIVEDCADADEKRLVEIIEKYFFNLANDELSQKITLKM